MLTIHLHQLYFHAYHGLYPEETASGADFEVNVDVSFLERPGIHQLKDTINYVMVYGIVSDNMKIATPLIETVAENIIDGVLRQDERITKVTVNIKKLNPPISGFQGVVGVTLTKER